MPIDSAAANQARSQRATATPTFNVADSSIGIASGRDTMDRWQFTADSPSGQIDDFNFNSNVGIGMGGVDNNFTWEMIGLGLEEPLPPQDTIDELSVYPPAFVVCELVDRC